MICPAQNIMLLRLLPMSGKVAVLVGNTLGGFNKGEFNLLRLNLFPVHAGLVMGYVQARHFIAAGVELGQGIGLGSLVNFMFQESQPPPLFVVFNGQAQQ